MNYFDILGLEPAFDLDLGQLEQQYFAAQKLFHPDRLIGKPAEQRQQSVSQSMLINDAYQALKNPLKRAQHLLFLNGISVGDEKAAVKPGIELLTEIMEIREKIVELDSRGAAAALGKAMENERDITLKALSAAFAQKDLQNAAQMTIRHGYLLKILDEIRIQTKRFEPV